MSLRYLSKPVWESLFKTMANNHTLGSFELPESWPSSAKEEFTAIMNILDDVDYGEDIDSSIKFPEGYENLPNLLDFDCLCLHGTTWQENNGTSVGYYDMESFDRVNIEIILKQIARKHRIPVTEKCYVSWAFTCDKPRVNEFGGGHLYIWDRRRMKA